jgi:hypothetical protein
MGMRGAAEAGSFACLSGSHRAPIAANMLRIAMASQHGQARVRPSGQYADQGW